jgi:hypothetical protein
MNPVESVDALLVQVKRSGPQWIIRAAGHAIRPFGSLTVALHHLLRGYPHRPFGFSADARRSRPLKTPPPDAHAISLGPAIAEDEIQEALPRIDDDRTWSFLRGEVDDSRAELGLYEEIVVFRDGEGLSVVCR